MAILADAEKAVAAHRERQGLVHTPASSGR